MTEKAEFIGKKPEKHSRVSMLQRLGFNFYDVAVFLFVTLLDDSATSQQFQRTFAPPRKDTFPFFMEQEFIKTLDPLEILRLLAVDPDHTAFEGIPTAPEIQRQVSIASDDDVEGAPDIDPGVPVLLFRRQEVIPGKLLEGIDLVSGQSIILNVLCR